MKDYLHLYLGCECITEENKVGKLCDIGIDYSKEIMLITVRYSDNDDDWDVFNDDPSNITRVKLLLKPIDCCGWMPFAFKRVLEEGYDVFDLISKGLAIDRTKMKV